MSSYSLVNPGVIGSPHLHQVVGGNSFNVTMGGDLPTTATCTSCTPVEDFSNYLTGVVFFRARNGTFKRVSTFGNELGYTAASGGQTVYYLSNGKVTAFKPGFRMTVGDPSFRTAKQESKYKYLTYTCLASSMTRGGDTTDFPKQPCKAGIMVSIRFPTCWDGKTLDSPDHQSHVAYPSGSACPSTHPVAIPQVFYETYWNTKAFNDKSLWPEDGSQPFVWSFGDATGTFPAIGVWRWVQKMLICFKTQGMARTEITFLAGREMLCSGPWTTTATVTCLPTRSTARRSRPRPSTRATSAPRRCRSTRTSTAG